MLPQRSYNSHLRSIELDTRGWRAFVAAPAMDAPVTVTLEALGYGGWSLPYGMEATLSADLRATPSPLRLHAGSCSAPS